MSESESNKEKVVHYKKQILEKSLLLNFDNQRREKIIKDFKIEKTTRTRAVKKESKNPTQAKH